MLITITVTATEWKIEDPNGIISRFACGTHERPLRSVKARLAFAQDLAADHVSSEHTIVYKVR